MQGNDRIAVAVENSSASAN